MKNSRARIIAFLILLAGSSTCFAQENTNPTGGLTIKTIQIEDTAWAFVEFVETDTEIANNCAAANTLFGTFPKVLWIDPAQAQLLSRKCSGLRLKEERVCI